MEDEVVDWCNEQWKRDASAVSGIANMVCSLPRSERLQAVDRGEEWVRAMELEIIHSDDAYAESLRPVIWALWGMRDMVTYAR